MHFYSRPILMAFAVVVVLSSCEEEKSSLNLETSYDPSGYQLNSEKAQNTVKSYQNLIHTLQEGNTGKVLDHELLSLEPHDGEIYLPSRIIGGFQPVLNRYVDEAIKNSGKSYSLEQSDFGGTNGGYLFTGSGLAIHQIVAKGLYGALFYYQSTKLLKQGMTKADLDMVLTYFGSDPNFSSNTSQGNVKAILAAADGCQRDKNDGNGFYTEIKNQFLMLQATIAAGPDFTSEQTEAITRLKNTWEKISAATTINACNKMITLLSSDKPTAADKANALNAYGEIAGLMYGWKYLINQDKIIEDREVKDIMVLLGMYESSSEAYKFITNTETELPRIQKVIDKLIAIYAFTPGEVDGFKVDWATVQGR